MKFLPALSLLVVIHTKSLASHYQIDSLQQLLPSLKDTARVSALNQLAFKLKFNNPQGAEQYAREAIRYAEDLRYYRGMAHGYQVLGISQDVRGQFREAITSYEKGLNIMTTHNVDDIPLVLSLHNVLGIAYYHQGNYNDALKIYLELVPAFEKRGDRDRLGKVLLNIGLVHHDQRNYDAALAYYAKSLEMAEAVHDAVVAGRAANNMGIVYKETERYADAIRYFNLSLAKKKTTADLQGTGSTLTNLGTTFKRLGNYSTALQYLDSAETIKKRLDDQPGLVIINDARAEIFITQGRLREAEALAFRNLSAVEPMGGENTILVYGRLYELFKAKGDFKNALYWHERCTHYNDSLFNETKSKQLAELQTLFEVSKKEKEIAVLEKSRQRDAFAKKVLIVSLVGLAGIAISVGYLIWFRARKRHQVHELELRLQQNMIENGRLRELELRKEIDFKNKSLASYTMNFVQKSELMEELRKNIKRIDSAEPETRKRLASLCRLIENSYHVDREWEDFKLRFENVHENFFKHLRTHCPELTNGDLRLCALLKLNMNMKEAARVLGISPESVKTARYRLRKKLNLGGDENLVEFIQNIQHEDPEGSRAVA